MTLAKLQCEVRQANGERCPNPATPGTTRCKRHRSAPPERKRCQHVWPDGVRCEVLRLPNGDFCKLHKPLCLNPGCERQVNHADQKCRFCIAADKRPPDCGFRMDDDRVCSSPAATDEGTCKRHHSTKLVTGDVRCHHRYSDGGQCHRRIRNNGTACAVHGQSCRSCGLPSNYVEAYYVCRQCRDRCAQPGCDSPVVNTTGYCPVHDQSVERCSEMSANTGTACTRPVVGDHGRCDKHADLPGDDDRCTFVFDNGQRCANTQSKADRSTLCKGHYEPIGPALVKYGPRGPNGQLRTRPCQVCGAACTGKLGFCDFHRPRCRATNRRGQRCRWFITDQDKHYCARHHDLPHPSEQCGTLIDDQELDGLVCTQPKAGPGQPCRAHGGQTPTKKRPICGVTTGPGAVGEPCRLPDLPGQQHCRWHHSPAPDADRCVWIYDNGDRCNQKHQKFHGNGAGLVCSDHRVACIHPGCRRKTSDLERQICPTHADRCSVTVADGRRCDQPAAMNSDVCMIHLVEPVDEIRCVHEFDTGTRCRRTVGVQHRSTRNVYRDLCPYHSVQCTEPDCNRFTAFSDGLCLEHRERVRTASVRHACNVITTHGEPCPRAQLFLPDGTREPWCNKHIPLPDEERCTFEHSPGLRCPGQRKHRLDYCSVHQTQQPRCVADEIYTGRRCFRHAPSGFDTCDYHANWDPDRIADDRADHFQRFFLTPNLDLVWAIHRSQQTSKLVNKQTILQTSAVPADEEPPSMSVDRYTDPNDPYDITGAAAAATQALAEGAAPVVADRIYDYTRQSLAQSTLRNLTSRARDYFEFCQDLQLEAVPADEATIARFIAMIGGRGRLADGKPLSDASMNGIRHAIVTLHTVKGFDDPFKLHPRLGQMLRGYRRLYGRAPIEAHGVTLSELASLITTINREGSEASRDRALITVVADPEVGISQRQATRITWENVAFPQGDGPTLAVIPGPRTAEFEIPNRTAEHPTTDSDVPVAHYVCGTAALRELAALTLLTTNELKGPVFRNVNGLGISDRAVSKIIKAYATQSGLPQQTSYNFDQRIALVEQSKKPRLRDQRDAAILAIAWWVSLRVSEVAALRLGDLAVDDRGRGTHVLATRDKTMTRHYVPVPHHTAPDGRRLPTDLQTVLEPWLVGYQRSLGRPLLDDDPVFTSTDAIGNDQPRFLHPDTIGQVMHRWAGKAGLKAELGERLTFHGLRAGHATEALLAGNPAEQVARNQGRSSPASLQRYFRLSEPFEKNFPTVTAPDEAFDDVITMIADHQRNTSK